MKCLLVLCTVAIASMALANDCCSKAGAGADEAFLREANLMMLRSEGKVACDRTTGSKAIVKGEAGCCEAPGSAKLFKVFVAGKYEFFSCPDSAGQARKQFVAKGLRVGPVQKVARK
jgi:hypothetical protein